MEPGAPQGQPGQARQLPSRASGSRRPLPNSAGARQQRGQTVRGTVISFLPFHPVPPDASRRSPVAVRGTCLQLPVRLAVEFVAFSRSWYRPTLKACPPSGRLPVSTGGRKPCQTDAILAHRKDMAAQATRDGRGSGLPARCPVADWILEELACLVEQIAPRPAPDPGRRTGGHGPRASRPARRCPPTSPRISRPAPRASRSAAAAGAEDIGQLDVHAVETHKPSAEDGSRGACRDAGRPRGDADPARCRRSAARAPGAGGSVRVDGPVEHPHAVQPPHDVPAPVPPGQRRSRHRRHRWPWPITHSSPVPRPLKCQPPRPPGDSEQIYAVGPWFGLARHRL